MQYIDFPGITAPLSRMIYGTAIRPLMEGENADEVLDHVFALGITTFDTARSYGQSENGLGRWLCDRNLRNRVNILTKGCNPDQTGIRFTPDSLRDELMQSLDALQTDYVDFYCLHRDDPEQEVSVFIDVLNQFKSEGRILAFGASNWHYLRMKEANAYAAKNGLAGFSFGSPAFSLAEVVGDPWGGSVHISGRDNADARRWFAENGIPVFSYSSFARGFFSGKYRTDRDLHAEDVLPPWTCEEYVCPENIERLKRAEALARKRNCTVGQINLAWILAQPFLCCPIFSPSTAAHIDENLKGLDLVLTEEEMKWLDLFVADQKTK